MNQEIAIIASMTKDFLMGSEKRGIRWRVKAERVRFKQLTKDNPVIMGRKTWQMRKGALVPDCQNVVLTRNPDFRAKGATVAHSIEECLDLFADAPRIMVIGGSEVFTEIAPYATKAYITIVGGRHRGNIWFPYQEYSRVNGWKPTYCSTHRRQGSELDFAFVELTKYPVDPNVDPYIEE